MSSKAVSSLSLVPFTAGVKQTPGDLLSNRLLAHIFGFVNNLTAQDLDRFSRVCKAWNQATGHNDDILWRRLEPKNIFPLLRTIDEHTWKKHIDCGKFGLDPTGAPSTYPTKAAVKAETLFLRRLFTLVENNAGVTLLTLPEGLNFKNLIESAKVPKTGKAVLLSYIWPRILAELVDKTLDQTVRVFITNGVLIDSRDKTSAEQITMASEAGGELTSTLASTALLILTFMESGERLCSDNPLTYMRNAEQVGGYHLVVGGFSPAGFGVYGNSFASEYYGAGVQRKFAAIGT
jgi:hypothetical protein